MGNLDLDAARKAREEADRKAPTVTFRGRTFTLPVEQPFSVSDAMYAARHDKGRVSLALTQVLHDLFGPQLESFLAQSPSDEDVVALIEGLSGLYAVDPGEAPASDGSSTSGSRPSKRTSSGSTPSTSGRPSGAASRSAAVASSP